jgi:hypothetical protein
MPDIVIVSEAGSLTIVEGSGTVYGVSVVSANGFAGSVAKDTTLPAITISTTITGIVKGNGTKISAATAGTDYIVPGGALGTPSSGTLTSCTGLPISTGVSGLGTGAATFLATPTSANLIALLTDETGTGAAVFANTPTLVTPNIGVANGVSLTLSGDLIVNGSTVTLNATTLEIVDKNIVIANVVTPTEITCDGAGITVKSSATDHTLNYVAATTAWTSSENIDLATGKTIKFNGVSVLSSTAINKVTVTAPATGSTLTIVDGATLTASATASVSGTNTGDNSVNTLYSSLITDATVVLTAGSGVTITGTYPSFTIAASSGGGTVTKTSVVSANGFTGTVATDTTTPAITITTSITGLLKGDGTAISAATAGTDYVVPSGSITGSAASLSATLAVASGGTGLATLTAENVILGNGTSAPTFVAPSTSGNVLTSNGTTWLSSAPAGGGGSGTVTKASVVSVNGFAGTVATDTTTPAITITTSITGLLKGDATAISAATAGTDYIVPAGALGTPSSGTLTSCTGLPISSGVSGLGTSVAAFLATPSSANLKTAITDETGTGGSLVFATSPALTTPTITGLIEVKTAPTISAGVLALNCALGNVFHVSLNAAITSLTFSNIPSSGSAYGLTLAFTADGTARAVTWPAAVKWAGGTAPTLTSTSSKVDIFVLTTWDAGTTWYSMIGGQNH